MIVCRPALRVVSARLATPVPEPTCAVPSTFCLFEGNYGSSRRRRGNVGSQGYRVAVLSGCEARGLSCGQCCRGRSGHDRQRAWHSGNLVVLTDQPGDSNWVRRADGRGRGVGRGIDSYSGHGRVKGIAGQKSASHNKSKVGISRPDLTAGVLHRYRQGSAAARSLFLSYSHSRRLALQSWWSRSHRRSRPPLLSGSGVKGRCHKRRRATGQRRIPNEDRATGWQHIVEGHPSRRYGRARRCGEVIGSPYWPEPGLTVSVVVEGMPTVSSVTIRVPGTLVNV